jgi:hypothetical protein
LLIWENGVTSTRLWTLTMGPVVLVATCYAIAAPQRPIADLKAASLAVTSNSVEPEPPLSIGCENVRRELRRQLPLEWAIVVHQPFVLAGDNEQTVEGHYEQTIVPTLAALTASYFQRPPRYPITILLCASDEQFQSCNLRLDQQQRNQYSGLYSRTGRRIIVNTASGDGTLAHELTHALAHADFPKMPEWFDEGLASLHEECEFSNDGLRLIGLENWRGKLAVEALHRGELRLLEDLASHRFGSPERAQVDYAHVRSFCQFLQDRGFLEPFYQTCRANIDTDPTGLRSLCAVAGTRHPMTIDDSFRRWLIGRPPVLSANLGSVPKQIPQSDASTATR